MTPPYTATLEGQADNVRAIIDVATRAVDGQVLEPGNIYAFVTTTGDVRQIDLTGDDYLNTPARKKGTVTVEDLPSFLTYWNKHHNASSELYVDIDRLRITAILDAHTSGDWEDGARWAQHRLILQAKHTPSWAAWAGYDRRELTQRVFAEFIEDHIEDIQEPSGAVMLEIAETFQTNSKVNFNSTVVLGNGDRRLSWDETTDASAGKSGNLQVPATFKLGLRPFDWSDVFGVDARFRYRVEQKALKVVYLLNEPEKVVRAAMLDLVADLEKALNPTDANGNNTAAPFKVMLGAPIAASA
jgi:uncharacterized protein YfdQ (DUF2303 family)